MSFISVLMDVECESLPHYTVAIKFDVEDMTSMTCLELAYHLSSVHIPNLDGSVIASADETSAPRIEGQCSNQHVMT